MHTFPAMLTQLRGEEIWFVRVDEGLSRFLHPESLALGWLSCAGKRVVGLPCARLLKTYIDGYWIVFRRAMA